MLHKFIVNKLRAFRVLAIHVSTIMRAPSGIYSEKINLSYAKFISTFNSDNVDE